MLCAPTERPEDVTEVLPPLSVCVPPRLTPLSVNCTVPLGVPTDDGLATTVAVKVTPWPNTVGDAGAAVTVVVVLAPITVWIRGSLTLAPDRKSTRLNS